MPQVSEFFQCNDEYRWYHTQMPQNNIDFHTLQRKLSKVSTWNFGHNSVPAHFMLMTPTCGDSFASLCCANPNLSNLKYNICISDAATDEYLIKCGVPKKCITRQLRHEAFQFQEKYYRICAYFGLFKVLKFVCDATYLLFEFRAPVPSVPSVASVDFNVSAPRVQAYGLCEVVGPSDPNRWRLIRTMTLQELFVWMRDEKNASCLQFSDVQKFFPPARFVCNQRACLPHFYGDVNVDKVTKFVDKDICSFLNKTAKNAKNAKNVKNVKNAQNKFTNMKNNQNERNKSSFCKNAAKAKYYIDCMFYFGLDPSQPDDIAHFVQMIKNAVGVASYWMTLQPGLCLVTQVCKKQWEARVCVEPVMLLELRDHCGRLKKLALVLKFDENSGTWFGEGLLTPHMAFENISLNCPHLMTWRYLQQVEQLVANKAKKDGYLTDAEKRRYYECLNASVKNINDLDAAVMMIFGNESYYDRVEMYLQQQQQQMQQMQQIQLQQQQIRMMQQMQQLQTQLNQLQQMAPVGAAEPVAAPVEARDAALSAAPVAAGIGTNRVDRGVGAKMSRSKGKKTFRSNLRPVMEVEEVNEDFSQHRERQTAMRADGEVRAKAAGCDDLKSTCEKPKLG